MPGPHIAGIVSSLFWASFFAAMPSLFGQQVETVARIRLTPEQFLAQFDKNGDGKLGPDELPAALFDRLDADKDGFVTEKELKALWRGR